VIAARLMAEKDNTRADAVWGLAVTNVDLLKKNGLLQAYTPKGFAAISPEVPRFVHAAVLVRQLRLDRGDHLQRDRGQETRHSAAEDVDRPDQPDLQGPDRDAASGVLGNRLHLRLGLAADDGGAEGVGVHGQAAPEHRLLHAFRLVAGSDGRARASASSDSQSSCAGRA
jgi:hypothetical protein